SARAVARALLGLDCNVLRQVLARWAIRRAPAARAGRTSINRMSLDAKARDVVVLGGGIIGLAVALSARERGMSVTVLERDRVGAGASSVAAGMLAPVAEAEFGDAAALVLELGLRSAALWPGFAARVQDAGGVE